MNVRLIIKYSPSSPLGVSQSPVGTAIINQNKSSFQSTRSLIVKTTSVSARIRFHGTSSFASYSSSLLPPMTDTLFWRQGGWASSLGSSCRRLKLPCVPPPPTLLLRQEATIRRGGATGFGRCVPPQINRTKRGRRLGRQALTTATDGSAADQVAAGT